MDASPALTLSLAQSGRGTHRCSSPAGSGWRNILNDIAQAAGKKAGKTEISTCRSTVHVHYYIILRHWSSVSELKGTRAPRATPSHRTQTTGPNRGKGGRRQKETQKGEKKRSGSTTCRSTGTCKIYGTVEKSLGDELLSDTSACRLISTTGTGSRLPP